MAQTMSSAAISTMARLSAAPAPWRILSGYYYDNEIGFYYLNSRYYNPEIGRFINSDGADVLAVEQGSFLQYNLFAYCLNNPINRFDNSGYLSLPNWVKVTIGVAVTVVTGGAAVPALIAVLKIAAVSAAAVAGTGAALNAVSHRVSTGSWKG